MVLYTCTIHHIMCGSTPGTHSIRERADMPANVTHTRTQAHKQWQARSFDGHRNSCSANTQTADGTHGARNRSINVQ